MRRYGVTLWMGAAVGIALVIAAIVLVIGGAEAKSIRLALDLTARWSFLLFWLAYAGGALALLCGPGFAPLAGRGREFGLAFAAAHLVHVVLVVWLYRISARPPLPQGLFWFFSIGLFWTYLLALLSFGGLSKALGVRLWRLVRFLGMNYILLAFARDFVLPVLYPKAGQQTVAHFIAYAPFAAMSIAAPLLVLFVTVRRRWAM
jgi:hypothetical protein